MQNRKANFQLADIDRQSLFHPATSIADHLQHGPLIASTAQGIWVNDQNGRNLMDFGAGLWCVNVGYGRSELSEAAAAAIRNLSYFPLFFSCSNEPAIRLADRILSQFHEHAGARHLSKVFFGTSGSEANDTKFKLVRYYNNLAAARQEEDHPLVRGYHGSRGVGQPHGDAGDSTSLRSARPGRAPRRCPHYYALPRVKTTSVRRPPGRGAEDIISARRCRHDCGIHRRAGEWAPGGVIVPPPGYFDRVQADPRRERYPFHR